MPSSPLNLNSAAPEATSVPGFWVIVVFGAVESSTYVIDAEQLEVTSELVVAVALKAVVESSGTLTEMPEASWAAVPVATGEPAQLDPV